LDCWQGIITEHHVKDGDKHFPHHLKRTKHLMNTHTHQAGQDPAVLNAEVGLVSGMNGLPRVVMFSRRMTGSQP
jgi:hypothetical protein